MIDTNGGGSRRALDNINARNKRRMMNAAGEYLHISGTKAADGEITHG